MLVAARILKPLGNPQPNAVKYFAATEILELSKDRAWLVRLTTTLAQHWRRKNARKTEQINFRSSDEPDDISPQRTAAV